MVVAEEAAPKGSDRVASRADEPLPAGHPAVPPTLATVTMLLSAAIHLKQPGCADSSKPVSGVSSRFRAEMRASDDADASDAHSQASQRNAAAADIARARTSAKTKLRIARERSLRASAPAHS
jgi:hypothetical protein